MYDCTRSYIACRLIDLVACAASAEAQLPETQPPYLWGDVVLYRFSSLLPAGVYITYQKLGLGRVTVMVLPLFGTWSITNNPSEWNASRGSCQLVSCYEANSDVWLHTLATVMVH